MTLSRIAAGQITGISPQTINSSSKVLKTTGSALSRINSVIISEWTIFGVCVCVRARAFFLLPSFLLNASGSKKCRRLLLSIGRQHLGAF